MDCPFAQQVWSKAPLSRSPNPGSSSMLQFLQDIKLVVNLPPSWLSLARLYPWICWHLWTTRNALLFEARHFSPVEVITTAVTAARQWQEAQEDLPKPRQPPMRCEQEIQVPSGTRIYVDAAWKNDSRRCGMGWTIFNGDVQILSASAIRSHVHSALAAEAWAICEALMDAKSRGLREAHILSDSLTLVKLLNSGDMHTEFQAITADIKEICDSFSVFSFSFVPRLSNSIADNLAKMALVNSLPDSSGV